MTVRERIHWVVCCGTLVAGIWLLHGRSLHADDKPPIPSGAALDEALKLVKDVYGDEHTKAESSEEKTAFAEKLLQTAKATNQGTANHYALLRVAWDVATQAGDAKVAMQITDAIASVYEVNALSARVATVKTTAGFARTSTQNTALASVALDVVDDAVVGDHYNSATELAEIALAAARKARDWQLVKRIVARGKTVTEMTEAHAKAQKALARLENDPTNPDANQAAGEYYCFVKGDWRKGIPMLALGTDAAVKALARRELQTPASPSEQAKLGDGWWDLGEKHDEDMKGRLRSRAAYWYRQAVPNLSGLVKQKYEKRIELVGDTDTPSVAKAVSSATDGWIDAFAAVDVNKHRVLGNWLLNDGELACVATEAVNRIEIPLAPKGDYDMRVSFTREQGTNGIGVVFCTESSQCLFLLSAIDNEFTGLWFVSGKHVKVPGKITNQERHELQISVRQKTGAVAFTAVLDGRPCFRWAGPKTALSLDTLWRLHSPRSIGLGLIAKPGNPVSATFHEVKLKAVRGTVQKLTDGKLSEKPSGKTKQPAVGSIPGVDSAPACTKLEAKKPPVELTAGAIPFKGR